MNAMVSMAGAGSLPSPAMGQRIARIRASRVRCAGLRPPLTPGYGISPLRPLCRLI
jgi:hypothetical protein